MALQYALLYKKNFDKTEHVFMDDVAYSNIKHVISYARCEWNDGCFNRVLGIIQIDMDTCEVKRVMAAHELEEKFMMENKND